MTGTTTVVVTELDATDALAPHARLARDVAARHNGRVAETLDTGVLALFGSAYDAVRAAVALQQQHERADSTASLRIGCDVGESVDAGLADDGFGATIARARDLCGGAEPSHIVVSDLVHALIGARGDVGFEALAVPGARPAYTVKWAPLPHNTAVRVAVADDVALVRSGVVRLLADEGFEVVGEAGDAEELLALVRAHVPGLVVTDIRMPPTQTDEGLRAAAEIRREFPEVAVLVLSQHIEARAAADLLDDRAAGVGYLLKERVAELDDFVDACRTVAGGGRVIDPLVTEQLFAAVQAGNPIERLTDREREVLGLMAQGRSNAAIAGELYMSPKTVESHVRSIFTKLDLAENPEEHRRVTAVIRWLQADH